MKIKVYGYYSKEEIDLLKYVYMNRKDKEFYSGKIICDKLWKNLPKTPQKTTIYNKLTKDLRVAFPHIIVGEGRATRHYYPKTLADKWVEDILNKINEGE